MDDMQWVRPPKQERSQRTQDLFLDTLEAMLEEQGVLTIQVKDIAKRADLSVGGFYSRFPNKEAVLRALHERFAVEAVATAEEALAPGRWEDVHLYEAAPRLVGFLAEDYRRRPGFRRALLVLNATDEEVRVRAQKVSAGTVATFERLLEAKKHQMRHPEVKLAAEFLHRLLFSALDNHVLFHGASTGYGFAHPRFVGELADAVLRYLDVVEPVESIDAANAGSVGNVGNVGKAGKDTFSGTPPR